MIMFMLFSMNLTSETVEVRDNSVIEAITDLVVEMPQNSSFGLFLGFLIHLDATRSDSSEIGVKAPESSGDLESPKKFKKMKISLNESITRRSN